MAAETNKRHFTRGEANEKYSLVKYVEDSIYYVVPTKSITPIEKNLIWAPYKKMGFYEAVIIEQNNDRKFLEERLKSLKKELKVLIVNTIDYKNSTEEHPVISDTINQGDFIQEIDNLQENSTPPQASDFQFDSDDSIKDPDYNMESDESVEVPDYGTEFIENEDENLNLENAIETPDLTVKCNDFRNSEKLDIMIHCGSEKNISQNILESKHVDLDYKKLDIYREKCKRHFCMFCYKLQTKFARHLQTMHKTEDAVKEFMELPVKNRLRADLIRKIRSKGDFMYNSNTKYNTQNNLITVRRLASIKNINASHYKPCGNCGGMYSSLSLAIHYRRCKQNRIKGAKDILVNSRYLSMFAPNTCSVLTNKILPALRPDEITETILSDHLILLFGNRLCQKYRSPHLYKMIRAKLRCVARFFLIARRKHDNITKFEHIFDPEHYDLIIGSINEMCSLNEETGRYKSPSTALAIGSYLKKIGFYLISEYIKQKQKDRQIEVRDFLQLLKEGLGHDIYKTVEENQLEQKRRKKIQLPSTDDIIALNNYLNRKIKMYMKQLRNEYSFFAWRELMSLVLISLQVFNRRRAGEIERVKIDDFLGYEELQSDDEFLKSCSIEEKNRTKNYIRFLIRGKLSRGVPVMVNKQNFDAIMIILKLRKQVNIPDNPYLFGLPGKGHFNHLIATQCINKYSKLCGAQQPDTLRGTLLRKHIATKCGTMNLQKTEIREVADYLGHDEKIHINHYRLPNATKDIVRMSNILEVAQGNANISSDFNDSLESVSNIVEGSPDNMNMSNCSYIVESNTEDVAIENKKNTKTPSRNSRKLSWSFEEKNCVQKCLGYYFNNFELPSLETCEDIISTNEILSQRSATQLKAFVANYVEKKKRETIDGNVPAKIRRRPWSAEERKIVLKIFEKELTNKTLPSLNRCKNVIEEYSILSRRTPIMLKAYINNVIKKRNT